MKVRVLFCALFLLLGSLVAHAAEGNKALMLTVFGTSTEASVTFDEILPLVQKQYPDRTVVIPYTSSIIRDKLNADISNPADKILSPEAMLNKLKDEGYKDIAVVSTLVFPGVEHDKLKATVDKFSAANKGIKVQYVEPILGESKNLKPVVDTLGKHMLKDGFNVVVSHGTHDGHQVEKVYLEIADLVAKNYPNAALGSIEGIPDMEETMAKAAASEAKDLRFIVFMFVAGDHAENDIASDDEDSLFTAAREMGKNPSVKMVETSVGQRFLSLGLDPEYRALLLKHYAEHLKK